MQVAVLRERLDAEYAALEAANVHAILDSTYRVPTVLRKIDGALSKLEDLELSLEVFDGKLAVMREDIAAIEARNNTLEVQARNLASLKSSLRELLSTLTTDRNVQKLGSSNLSFTPDQYAPRSLCMSARLAVLHATLCAYGRCVGVAAVFLWPLCLYS